MKVALSNRFVSNILYQLQVTCLYWQFCTRVYSGVHRKNNALRDTCSTPGGNPFEFEVTDPVTHNCLPETIRPHVDFNNMHLFACAYCEAS